MVKLKLARTHVYNRYFSAFPRLLLHFLCLLDSLSCCLNGAGSCYILMSGPLSKWKEMRGLLPALPCFALKRLILNQLRHTNPHFVLCIVLQAQGWRYNTHTVEHLAARWITVKEQKNDDKGEEPLNG